MQKTRWSKRCSLLVVAASAFACGERPLVFPTREALPAEKPPLGETEPVPQPSASGETRASRLALEEPVGEDEALAVARRFLRLVETRDERRLAAELGPAAVWLARPDRPAGLLAPLWSERLRRLSYDKLAGTAYVDRLEVLDARRAGTTLDREEGRPEGMRPGDLVVRIRFSVTRLGAERLFADELDLLLRRDVGKVRIIAATEDFSLP